MNVFPVNGHNYPKDQGTGEGKKTDNNLGTLRVWAHLPSGEGRMDMPDHKLTNMPIGKNRIGWWPRKERVTKAGCGFYQIGHVHLISFKVKWHRAKVGVGNKWASQRMV